MEPSTIIPVATAMTAAGSDDAFVERELRTASVTVDQAVGWLYRLATVVGFATLLYLCERSLVPHMANPFEKYTHTKLEPTNAPDLNPGNGTLALTLAPYNVSVGTAVYKTIICIVFGVC